MLMATNLRLRACLTMCLNFPRFEPQVAYKTLAYKKKKKCTSYAANSNDQPRELKTGYLTASPTPLSGALLFSNLTNLRDTISNFPQRKVKSSSGAVSHGASKGLIQQVN